MESLDGYSKTCSLWHMLGDVEMTDNNTPAEGNQPDAQSGVLGALQAAKKALNLAEPWVGTTVTAAIVLDAIKTVEAALRNTEQVRCSVAANDKRYKFPCWVDTKTGRCGAHYERKSLDGGTFPQPTQQPVGEPPATEAWCENCGARVITDKNGDFCEAACASTAAPHRCNWRPDGESHLQSCNNTKGHWIHDTDLLPVLAHQFQPAERGK